MKSRYINIDKVLSELCLSHKDIIYIDKNETAERIRKIPSIDIVRCKECRWWLKNLTEDDEDEAYLHCPIEDGKPVDFCSYGERKESE